MWVIILLCGGWGTAPGPIANFVSCIKGQNEPTPPTIWQTPAASPFIFRIFLSLVFLCFKGWGKKASSCGMMHRCHLLHFWLLSVLWHAIACEIALGALMGYGGCTPIQTTSSVNIKSFSAIWFNRKNPAVLCGENMSALSFAPSPLSWSQPQLHIWWGFFVCMWFCFFSFGPSLSLFFVSVLLPGW